MWLCNGWRRGPEARYSTGLLTGFRGLAGGFFCEDAGTGVAFFLGAGFFWAGRLAGLENSTASGADRFAGMA